MTVLCNFNISVFAVQRVAQITPLIGHSFKAHGTQHGGEFASRYNTNFEQISMRDYGVVFCLEPWSSVDNGDVLNEDDLNNALADANLRKTIAKIGYYRYWQTDKSGADYVTTQMMIWEARGWMIDEASSYYQSMKSDVETEVDNHYKSVDFDQTYEEVIVNKKIK